MTATIHRIASARTAKRRSKTDRQRYADALNRQKPRADWEVELDAMIGPAGDHDYTPPGAA